MEEKDLSVCRGLPLQLSSFIDTFVDFSVSGLFFPSNPNPSSPNPHPNHQQKTLIAAQSRPLQTRLPSPDRLVAVGDLHGDLEKSKQALRLAGLIDASGHWTGGDTTVVQIGDVLDRGGDEIKIFYFLEKLKREASLSGGSIITMNGNHEIMNVDGDFRYVTRSGLDEFRVWSEWYCIGNSMKSLCHDLEKPKDLFEGIPSVFPGIKEEYHPGFRARIAALRPGGPISSRFLAGNQTVLIIGDSVFVHGGLLQNHVLYGLERINDEIRDWINGSRGRRSPSFARGRESVVWLRKFSDELAKNCDCSALEHVLRTIPGAKRMIMGHTIQESGINGVCENRAIRIDVGLSKGCIDGLPEVLEINGNSEVRILTHNPLLHSSSSSRGSGSGCDSSLKVDQKGGLGLLVPDHAPRQIEVKA